MLQVLNNNGVHIDLQTTHCSKIVEDTFILRLRVDVFTMQLAYLPDKKREYTVDDDAGSYGSEIPLEVRDDVTSLDELVKDYKRNRRRGMLSWFKLKVPTFTLNYILLHWYIR